MKILRDFDTTTRTHFRGEKIKKEKRKKESWNWSIPRSIYFGPNRNISINSAQDQHKKPKFNSYPPHTLSLSLSLSLKQWRESQSPAKAYRRTSPECRRTSSMKSCLRWRSTIFSLSLSPNFLWILFFFPSHSSFPSLLFRNFLFLQTLPNLSKKLEITIEFVSFFFSHYRL